MFLLKQNYRKNINLANKCLQMVILRYAACDVVPETAAGCKYNL